MTARWPRVVRLLDRLIALLDRIDPPVGCSYPPNLTGRNRPPRLPGAAGGSRSSARVRLTARGDRTTGTGPLSRGDLGGYLDRMGTTPKPPTIRHRPEGGWSLTAAAGTTLPLAEALDLVHDEADRREAARWNRWAANTVPTVTRTPTGTAIVSASGREVGEYVDEAEAQRVVEWWTEARMAEARATSARAIEARRAEARSAR